MGTMKKNAVEELRKMLHEIDGDGEGLSDWEREFVADMIDRDVSFFTAKQAVSIRRIWEQRVGNQ